MVHVYLPVPAPKEYELVRTVRERRSQLHAMAQFFALMHRFAATAQREGRDVNPMAPELHAYTQQINTLEQEINRLERVIRENGGVIHDKKSTTPATSADQEALNYRPPNG